MKFVFDNEDLLDVALRHLEARMKEGCVADKAMQKLLGKIRQKKGFYSVSVGHSEVKQAHKAGILKGLHAAEKEIETAWREITPPSDEMLEKWMGE